MKISFQVLYSGFWAALAADILSDVAHAFVPVNSVANKPMRLFSTAGVDGQQKQQIPPGGVILSADEEAALLEASDFPIAPEELIEKCKQVLIAQRGIQDLANFDESIYADDFKFVAPFVGGPTPRNEGETVKGMPKSEFLDNIRGFDLLQAFPDMDNRYHGFYVD